jgi:pimeloyl-ACP methyl ester carboxylesterase
MRRTAHSYARIVTILAGAFLVLLGAGCGGGGGAAGDSATPSPTDSGSPVANVVQAAPVKHVAVGDLSVGYRVIGPLAKTTAGDTAAAGDETPLLLIMGSSGTMDLWSPAFVAALAQDRQVMVFDNRGIGETDDPMGGYPFSQLADDTAELIKALGHDSMDVLGWSMGGDVALDLAVRHPEVVSRLVSYAGDAGGSLAIPPSRKALATLMDTSGSPRQRGERLLELLFPEAYRSAHPEYLRAFPIPTERAAAAAIGLQNRAIGEWAGVWGGLKGIACPTLFVTGTEDVLTPPQNAVMMAERVPGSWLMRFAVAGHGLMYQDPQGLAESVLLFFKVTATEVAAGG